MTEKFRNYFTDEQITAQQRRERLGEDYITKPRTSGRN